MVEKELQRLETLRIVKPVKSSKWAAPIVPVLKPDHKSIRICGNYNLTANKASRLEQYPLPKVEDLFSTLAGSITFTKLDMSQAYQQLVLDDNSKEIVTINTHNGLFSYQRLPFLSILCSGYISKNHGDHTSRSSPSSSLLRWHPCNWSISRRVHVQFERGFVTTIRSWTTPT